MRRLFAALLVSLVIVALAACGLASSSATSGSGGLGPTATPTQPTGAVESNTSAGGNDHLIVFAAASLTDAFGTIGEQFEAATGASVTFNFAGSPQLAQQIVQGAPADVFASANVKQMEVMIEAGEVQPGSDRVFARNRLVVIYPHDNPAELSALQDLARPGIRLVLAAQEVPAGQYALDFLDQASQDAAFDPTFGDDVLKNVVSYEENVRAVQSKVTLGEADAGIVYRSDVTRDAVERVGQIDIPGRLNTLAAYPIAPLEEARNAELAQQFVDYVLSPEAQAILEDYRFLTAIKGRKR